MPTKVKGKKRAETAGKRTKPASHRTASRPQRATAAARMDPEDDVIQEGREGMDEAEDDDTDDNENDESRE